MKLLLVELLLLTLSIIDAKEEKESGVLNDLYNFLTMKFKPSSYRIRGRLRPCLWKICSRPLRKNYKLSAQEQVTTKEPQSAQKSGYNRRMFGDDDEKSNSDEHLMESWAKIKIENQRFREINDKLKRLEIELVQNVSQIESLDNLAKANEKFEDFLNKKQKYIKKIDHFLLFDYRKETINDVKLKHEIDLLNKHLNSYIDDKIERGNTVVSAHKLQDDLFTIGYSRQRARELINHVQNSFDGSIHLVNLHAFVEQFSKLPYDVSAGSEMHLSQMLNCALMPCFLDSFLLDSKPATYYMRLSNKMFRFLVNHRFTSGLVNEPYLENRIRVNEIRRKILFELEAELNEIASKNCLICTNEKCYRSMSVCCTREKMTNFIDGRHLTYWQASSVEKCEEHWIHIDLKDSIRPTSLSLNSLGDPSEDSLKALTIEVKIGNEQKIETLVSKCEYTQTLNTDYLLCTCFPTDQKFTYLKIIIKQKADKIVHPHFSAKTNSLIRVKAIKLVGKQQEVSAKKRTSVMDASMCWYFEMVSTMAIMHSQLMPDLYRQVLNMTKSALESMPPLSILLDQTLLSANVLDKADTFFKNFLSLSTANDTDKSEAILIYLEFNLARGHLKSILNALLIILNNFNLDYNSLGTIIKIEVASKFIYQEVSYPIGVKQIKSISAGDSTGVSSSGPDSLFTNTTSRSGTNELKIELNQDNSELVLEPSQQGVYNVLLEVQDEHTVTGINMKMKPDIRDLEGAIMVFSFYVEKPDLGDFEKFDEFNREKFDAFIQIQRSGTKEEAADVGFDVKYVDFSYNQVLAVLPLSYSHLVKFILVKFLRKKDSHNSMQALNPLYIKQLTVLGCQHHQFGMYKELKKLQVSTKNVNETLTLTLVSSVLWFLFQLAEHQKSLSKSCRATEANKELLIFSQFQIDDLWQIYEKAVDLNKQQEPDMIKNNLHIPILILLYQFVNCDEIKESIAATNHSHKNIFDNLREIVDNTTTPLDSTNNTALIIRSLTKEILKNGILVFFSCVKIQKQVFMQMIQTNIEQGAANKTDGDCFSFDLESTHILFESFCDLYSKNKTLLIKHLVKNSTNMFESWSDCNELLNFIDKLIRFSFLLNDSVIFKASADKNTKLTSSTTDLLNAIQSYIFYKMKEQLSKVKNLVAPVVREHIQRFIIKLAGLLIENSNVLTKSLLDKRKTKELLALGFKSAITPFELMKFRNYSNKIVYNFVLWLSEVFGELDSRTCTSLVEALVGFHSSIVQIEKYVEDEKPAEEEKVLKTWTFNSKLRSHQSDIQIDYTYPMATRFVIEFDSNCHLSTSVASIDQDISSSNQAKSFSFIDSQNSAHKISGELGSSTWNRKLELASSTFIQFVMQLNKEQLDKQESFFVKFTVAAMGFDKLTNRVHLTDLLESLTCLIGGHLSRVYSIRFISIESLNSRFCRHSQQQAEGDPISMDKRLNKKSSSGSSATAESGSAEIQGYINDLNSEFYRVLFRGGLSSDLSENSKQSSNIRLHTFLTRLVNFYKNIDDEGESADLLEFLKLYDTKSFTSSKTAFIYAKGKAGGIELSELILTIFVCLIWHQPKIKYEHLFKTMSDSSTQPIKSELVASAFRTAETSRMYIIEQQHQFKFKSMQDQSAGVGGAGQMALVDIIRQKVMYLLRFERLSERLVDYELKRQGSIDTSADSADNHSDHELQQHVPTTPTTNSSSSSFTAQSNTNYPIMISQNTSSNAQQQQQQRPLATVAKKKLPFLSRLSNSTSTKNINLVFEFILDNQSLDTLEIINQVLDTKRTNASLIAKNFELAIKFLENSTDSNILDKRKVLRSLEFILTFLSSFFNAESGPSTPSVAPAVLKFKCVHYLQNLYGCGLEMENQVRNWHYKFIQLILDLDAKFRAYIVSDRASNNFLERLNFRMNCFAVNFLDCDWEIYDWSFVSDANLIGYLLKNVLDNVSIVEHVDESMSDSTSQILEEAFSLNRADFNRKFGKLNGNGTLTSYPATPTQTSIATPIENRLDPGFPGSEPFDNTAKEEDCFDLKIFPKLYQSLFQSKAGNKLSGSFDSSDLMKHFTAEIKTYEQYEKFIVTRYMFWKFFSKLKARFSCDSCEICLTDTRYVCLDCRDHCLCFDCFAKSSIEDPVCCETAAVTAKSEGYFKDKHMPSHRMLLLDHQCSRCGSLILGKRVRCDECSDNVNLCFMCHRRFDEPLLSGILEANSDLVSSHLSTHLVTIIEPSILVARREKILDSQVYLHLHAQMLFNILTLRLSNLLAVVETLPDGGDSDQEFDHYKPEDFSLTYVKKLHSQCTRFILFMIKNISGMASSKTGVSAVLDSCIDHRALDNLKMYVTYNQEELLGLLASIVRMNVRQLRAAGDDAGTGGQSLPAGYLDRTRILEDFFTFKTDGNVSVASCKANPTKSEPNIYQLIVFVVKLLIERKDYSLEDTNICMLVSIFKELLLEAEPTKCDSLVTQTIAELSHKHDYLQLIDTESKGSEPTLELLLHWIDESMESRRLFRLVGLYINTIAELNANHEWKRKVHNFIDKVFSLILESLNNPAATTARTKCIQPKLYNFLYALNCAPLSTSIGQWIELKNNDLIDGVSGQKKSNNDFKLALLKDFHYEDSANAFTLTIFEGESRDTENLKDLKYDHDFRKPEETSPHRSDTCLDLNQSLIIKLIQLFKQLLSKYNIMGAGSAEAESCAEKMPIEAGVDCSVHDKEKDYGLVPAVTTATINVSPLKQKLNRYELMHIDRKREVNHLFQHLHLRNGLLLLSVLTLIKDFILRKNRDDEIASRLNTCSEEDSTVRDELNVDFEFIKWIAKLAFSNTNMNAFWKITHLRSFLVTLLLREGFRNLKREDLNFDVICMDQQKRANNEASSRLCSLPKKSKYGSPPHIYHRDSPSNETTTTAPKKQINSKDNDQTIDDLKMNLSSFVVRGICDISSAHFTLSEMTSNSASTSSSTSKSLDAFNDLRNKRSLKLLEDSVKKLGKLSDQETNRITSTYDICGQSKTLPFNMETFGSKGNEPNWITELQSCMSKYMQAHSCAAGAHKNCDNLKHDNKPSKFSTTFKQSYKPQNPSAASVKPIQTALKLVSNAAIVLTCRELLILFINWSFKEANKRSAVTPTIDESNATSNEISLLSVSNTNVRAQPKISIRQINCETEFELLQLLDILYYTDSSVNYKMFIRNLIASLNLGEKSSGEDHTKPQVKVLNKIVSMACDFMLPEYKQIKKVSLGLNKTLSVNDAGKIKNKQTNEALYEENLNNFLMPTTSKNSHETQTELGLSSKPNDIEKLSTNEGTLLIIFDTKKSSNSNNGCSSGVARQSGLLSYSCSTKSRLLRFKNFLKYSTSLGSNKKGKSEKKLNKKYQVSDSYENSGFKDVNQPSDERTSSTFESDDSINLIIKSRKKKLTRSKRRHATGLDTFSSSNDDDESLSAGQDVFESVSRRMGEEDGYERPEDENDDDDDDDDEEEDEDEDEDERAENARKARAKKIDELKKKPRICFQVIRRRRECNSNFDSANDDYDMNDSIYEDYDEEEDDDDDDDDTNDSDEDEDSYNSDSRSDHSNEDWDVAGDPNYACNDSNEECFRKSTFKLCLDRIEYSPYLAINNLKLLKWKFILGDENKSPGVEAGLDTCSFKIYQSVSKNFPSAFYLVDELIDQLSIKKFQRLNEIWSYLIKVSCAQVFNYRLKVFSLLIKILQKVLDEPDMDKKCINIFNLKPLKSLQASLESPTNKDDRNLLRALYDLFFVADKLAIKWSIEEEYQARLKSRGEIIERLCEVSYFIGLIQASFGDTRRKQEALSVEPCPLETNVQRIWSNADTGSDEDDRTYESCDESATNSGGSGGVGDCLSDDVEGTEALEENSEINNDSSGNTCESST